MTTQPAYLLYVVEDDDDDRFLLQQALKRHSFNGSLRFFTHGAELFTRLTHRLDGRLPDLIFLDLHTPIMNGFDTLRLLKQTEEFQRIPVVIRTGQDSLDQINRCYELGCHAYLTKHELALPVSSIVGNPGR